MAVQLNKILFSSRLRHVYDAWNNASANDDYGSLASTDALLFAAGDPAGEDEPIRKGTAFQTWLLGYEFPSTFILFEKDKIWFLSSMKKAKILAQIQNANTPVPVEVLAQAKPNEPPTDALPKLVERFTSHQRVGTLLKESQSGKLVNEWNQATAESSSKPEMLDIAPAVATLLAVKDEEELKIIRTAANLTSTLMTHHIAVKLETILDREAKISHEQFAAQIEMRLGSGEGDKAKGPDMKVWSKGRLTDVDWQSTEFCYSPIIQSRSSSSGYDLRFTAESTEDNIAHEGVILVSVGMRYKGYCANLGRSFIVNPTREQEAIYGLLVSLQTSLLSFIKEGVTARDVYQHALSFVKEKKPELEKHFVKNIGFGIGMEFRDSTYLISPRNGRPLKAGMTINLVLGFSELQEDGGKKYALQLADTILVNQEKSTLLTEGVKAPKETLFFLNPADGDEAKPSGKEAKKPPAKPVANGHGSPVKNKTAGGKVLRNKTRRQEEELQSTLARIMEHQRELHAQLQAEGLAKYSEGGGGSGGKEGKTWKRFQSYKGEIALPREVENLRIYVDRKAQTVILPVYGFAVPFHINTIKNVSKNDEGDYTYLRINFQTPGQLAGKKEDTPFEDPDASFIRSMSYRSADGHRFDSIAKQITDLKKEVNKREQQKKEMADVIEQDTLVEVKGRRPQKLPEVFVRPALDGKRLPGEVEIHQNGLRYQSPASSQKLDVLYSNIKHLFFQPCDHELLVIVHIHLKAPIMIGKRKAWDVQFFREASDVQFDETGNRKRKYRYGDEDEIEMEQQERKRRQMLNKEFRMFAEKIAEAATASTGDTLEPDIPFRELSFEGVPFRTNVRLQPTTECLVYLSDPPFLVVTLSEIEIASLERVQFGLKQFDLVLIFKDFTKPPLHINSIPSAQLDDVKNWLDSVDIPLSEGPVNLNWGPIMKTINEDPYDFFQQGGWSFLGGATGGESDKEESSEEESEYEEEPAESDYSESEDEESDYGDSAGSDEGSGSDFDDDSDGDDWDELERKAAKSDRKRAEEGRGADSDDSDAKPKKKAPAKTNGKSKARR
ncbi:SPT16-domain-containing protein [Gloeophyllum trabeum ATCC 11539]|uniref:FACT complex subunit n=1 Tax=Gloeophyllum trabeum (strain ATCC 11539 / FP-39264 / Madison 617) TaxID=670483 RepID=S7RXZ0_GLOTA|nr:SPT16-domain-containing protein [Gloeophyllum trabeum ATCC 11539]EPQ58254.1 SPT16-domain-containing protein [Gloeophyllum trabeum ATCC 11539]